MFDIVLEQKVFHIHVLAFWLRLLHISDDCCIWTLMSCIKHGVRAELMCFDITTLELEYGEAYGVLGD
jgi:hypothetical protein